MVGHIFSKYPVKDGPTESFRPMPMLEQRRDPVISVTTVLAGKLDDRLRECILGSEVQSNGNPG
jgi:hypothetical protein